MYVAQLGCSCPGAELDCTSARVPSTASLPVLGVGNAPVTGHVELYTELMGVWWLTYPIFTSYSCQILFSTSVWSRYKGSLAPQLA